MYTSIPFDLQENVFTRLSPKARVNMMLALPKHIGTKLYKAERDKPLVVIDAFIKRNIDKIRNKEIQIPQKMHEFIVKYNHEHYIKQYGIKVDVCEIDNYNTLLEDIQNNNVSPTKMYNCHFNEVNIEGTFNECITRYASPETFCNLYENDSTKQYILSIYLPKESFLWYTYSYENDVLRHFLRHGDYSFKHDISGFVEKAERDVVEPSSMRIFASRSDVIAKVIAEFNPPKSTLEYILDYAEQSMYVDTYIVILNALKRAID